MRICESCGQSFSTKIEIDGKTRNLQRRRYCLTCSPFGAHNTGLICNSMSMSERRLVSLARRNRATQERISNRRKQMAQMAVESKGGKCQICGYNRCIAALEFHHVDPTQKLFGIRCAGNTMSWEKMRAELDKCVLLCANCHREVEAGLVNLTQTTN